MKAITLDKHNVEIIDVPEPQIENANDVKIKLCYSSICGNDMQIYKGKMAPYYGKSFGLESSGIVIETGKNVNNLKVGDHVTIELLSPCGECAMCKSGHPTYCLNPGDTNGQMREYAIYRSNQLVKINDDIDLKEASLIEPLSLCLKCIDCIPELTGKKILILGGGAFGLITLKLLKRFPVSMVVIADPNENKRKMAENLGADYVIDSSAEDYISQAMDIVDCLGYDAVIETSGNGFSANIAQSFAARGGIVLFNALYGNSFNLSLNLFSCYWKDLTIRGVYPPESKYYYAANTLLKSLHLSDIITAVFPYEQAKDAFFLKAAGGQVKVCLDFTENRFKTLKSYKSKGKI